VGWEAFPPSWYQDIKAKQFSIPFKKRSRAKYKKLKENCFALLAEVRRAETRSGIIRAIFVRNRFELRSAIATKVNLTNFVKLFILNKQNKFKKPVFI